MPCMYMCSWSLEEAAGVTGSCQPPSMDAGPLRKHYRIYHCIGIEFFLTLNTIIKKLKLALLIEVNVLYC